ncbi:uncharacterized protein LOC128550549 [Mercenaria mercenaria]|uniref:uncharacterized protein LOC128550549 n=1 Tax=Mercenaria mercenaria TaxID=6596 RepID=UPI00234E548B|nr:uncharacterized protein LOC128550549 [Mercenaria mercenaria]
MTKKVIAVMSPQNRVVFLRLTLSVVDGTGNACEDIDHQACVAMAMQNAKLCDEPMFAQTACPKYCNNCPTSCYSCNISSHDVSSCNTVTCGRDQVCMDETIPTRNGHRHILGCESRAMCTQNQPGTLRCCTDDLCNMPVTPSTVKPATTLPTTTVRPTTTLPTITVRPTTAYTPRLTTPFLPGK